MAASYTCWNNKKRIEVLKITNLPSFANDEQIIEAIKIAAGVKYGRIDTYYENGSKTKKTTYVRYLNEKLAKMAYEDLNKKLYIVTNTFSAECELISFFDSPFFFRRLEANPNDDYAREIYVGNISESVDDVVFYDRMEKYGIIEKYCFKRCAESEGRGTSFGFVTYTRPYMAQRALEEGHLEPFKNKIIKIEITKGVGSKKTHIKAATSSTASTTTTDSKPDAVTAINYFNINNFPAYKSPILFDPKCIPSKSYLYFDVEKLVLKKDEVDAPHELAASVIAVVSIKGELILHAYIGRNNNNICSYYQKAVKINKEKIETGICLGTIQTLLKHMCNTYENTLVGFDIQSDLISLGLSARPNHFKIHDTSNFFSKVTPSNTLGNKISLAKLAEYYYPNKKAFQSGTHSAISDARMTALIHKIEIEYKDDLTYEIPDFTSNKIARESLFDDTSLEKPCPCPKSFNEIQRRKRRIQKQRMNKKLKRQEEITASLNEIESKKGPSTIYEHNIDKLNI